ncbi:MAG TPA: ATP-binding protein [Bacillus bacterium]|nr:ATP-binding protein [Bacillus sp. (in: firmicutes)]
MINLVVTFPAQNEYIVMTRNLFQSAILIPNELEKKKILFAINEAIINAVTEMKKIRDQHHPGTMTIELYVNDEEVKIHIINPYSRLSEKQKKEIVNKTFFDVGLDERGRGFLFIKGFMDEVWFDITEHGEFLVGMSKKL